MVLMRSQDDLRVGQTQCVCQIAPTDQQLRFMCLPWLLWEVLWSIPVRYDQGI